MKKRTERAAGAVLVVMMLFSVLRSAPVHAEEETYITKSTAKEIAVNEQISDTLSNVTATNYYKVTLPENGYAAITFSHDYVNSRGAYFLKWKDAEDNTFYSGESGAGNTDEITSANLGVKAGVYYISISCAGYEEGFLDAKYRLKVNYTVPAVGEFWETEFNDSVKTAQMVELNQTINGNLFSADDKDYYQFTLPSDGVVALDFTHQTVNSGNNLWTTWLLNETEENLTSLDPYDSYTGKEREKTGVSIGLSGTYYVCVAANNKNNWSSANYQLTVSYTEAADWEKEPNNSVATANPLTVGASVTGGIIKGDTDYYKITLLELAGVKLNFNHGTYNGDGNYKINLLNGSRINIIDELRPQFKEQGYVKTLELPAGESYLSVACSPFGWNDEAAVLKYTLTLEPLDCNWVAIDGKSYWYEKGVRQGTYDDAAGVIGDGTIRGREIADPADDAWYWLDSIYDGAKAVGKEVWMPYIYQAEDTWDDATRQRIADESDAGMGELVLRSMREKRASGCAMMKTVRCSRAGSQLVAHWRDSIRIRRATPITMTNARGSWPRAMSRSKACSTTSTRRLA